LPSPTTRSRNLRSVVPDTPPSVLKAPVAQGRGFFIPSMSCQPGAETAFSLELGRAIPTSVRC
jgi:hypothetical protein